MTISGGLRRTGESESVTRHLGQLDVTSRRASGLAGADHTGTLVFGSAVEIHDVADPGAKVPNRPVRGVSKAPKGKLGRRGEARSHGFNRPAAVGGVKRGQSPNSLAMKKALVHGASTVGTAGVVGLRTAEDVMQRVTNAKDLSETAEQDVKRATGLGVDAGLRATGRVGSAIGRKAVKGGIIATRNRLAGKVGAKAVTTASSQAARSVSARAAVATANAVRALVIRLVTALITSIVGSTPITLAIGVAVVIIAIILSFFAWIPGFEEATHEAKPVGYVGSIEMKDDYPYRGKYGEVSPFRYYYGNCTDFAAWRVNRDAGSTKPPWKYTVTDLTPAGGNGYEWGKPQSLPGWVNTTTPVPGDIISYGRGVMGASAEFGHVAYIAAVDADGNMTVENYGSGQYYITTHTRAQLAPYLKSGEVVIKHNPAGRVGPWGGGDASGDAKNFARTSLNDDKQFACLDQLWTHESNWDPAADNPTSDAYGIPQALPGEKMASAGADWKTNPITQVKWGLGYIKDRYGTPCAAWSFWQSKSPHWY